MKTPIGACRFGRDGRHWTGKDLGMSSIVTRTRIARIVLSAALGLPWAASGPGAWAGVYSDDLTKCLVQSSNSADHTVLVRWMFSALSLHPAVQPMSSVTSQQRDEANKQVEALFSRLLTHDCQTQAVNALKYEGTSAVGVSFRVLGQVAARDLMSDPNVEKGIGGLGVLFAADEKFRALLKEAGVGQPGSPQK
jgi:hypothetical protein